MKGVIVTNGYYSSAASVNQAERMRLELNKLGAETEIIKNDSPCMIGEKFFYDYAVFFDKDINLAESMQNGGVAVFNSPQAIEKADDKIKTAIILSKNGIKTPLTVPSPKRYFYEKADESFLRRTGELLGYPLVVKEAKGSLGKQVYLVNNYEELKFLDEKTADKDKLFQKFVGESEGKSYRVIVIGKKYFCGMLLQNERDFRSNAHEGGNGKEAVLSREYIETAEKVSEILGLDYCGVDFFVNEPAVIEVNSNAYFETVEKVTGKNVAERYAEYIVGKTEGVCRN